MFQFLVTGSGMCYPPSLYLRIVFKPLISTMVSDIFKKYPFRSRKHDSSPAHKQEWNTLRILNTWSTLSMVLTLGLKSKYLDNFLKN